MGNKYENQKLFLSTNNTGKRIIKGNEIEYECYKERKDYILIFNPDMDMKSDQHGIGQKTYYSKEIKFKNEEIEKETIEYEEFREFYDNRWRRTLSEKRKIEYEKDGTTIRKQEKIHAKLSNTI